MLNTFQNLKPLMKERYSKLKKKLKNRKKDCNCGCPDCKKSK